MRGWIAVLLTALSVSCAAQTQKALQVERAWIRAMPPGAHMQAGYAQLRNASDQPLRVTGARSADYGEVSLHQTIDEDGVSKMRPLEHLDIGVGRVVALEPGGRHLMLMMPSRELPNGAMANIDFILQDGSVVSAAFAIADSATDVVADPAPRR